MKAVLAQLDGARSAFEALREARHPHAHAALWLLDASLPGGFVAGTGIDNALRVTRQLVDEGMIDHETAYEAAPNVEELKMTLKGIRTNTATILG